MIVCELLKADELLKAYSKELRVHSDYSMTLEELIESHRSLRETNKVYLTQFNEELNRSVKHFVNMTITDQYVRWDELDKMTLAEIALRIA